MGNDTTFGGLDGLPHHDHDKPSPDELINTTRTRSDGLEITTLAITKLPTFELRHERLKHWDASANPPPVEVMSAYTLDGHFIGEEDAAIFLAAQGIKPELRSPEATICTIGFCEREQRWFGWSHRAIAGFGIGDKIYEDAFGRDDLRPQEHGELEITTLEQARQAACNYAQSVS